MSDENKPAHEGFWTRVTHFLYSIDQPQKPPVAGHFQSFAEHDLELSLRLKTLLKNQGEITAGTIHVVNLNEVREKLTAEGRWERVRERVEVLASQVIRDRISPADVFLEFPGPIYLIVFAQLGAEQARIKCGIMAKEIERHLLGCADGVQVRTAIAQITKDGITIEQNDFASDAVRLIHNIVHGQPATPPASPLKGRRSAEDAHDNEDAPWMTAEAKERAFTNPWIVSDPVRDSRKRAWYYESELFEIPELSFLYVPMWHVRNRLIGIYNSLPALPLSDGRMLAGDAVFSVAPASLVYEVNISILRAVAGEIRRLLKAGSNSVVAMPVHFETIASASRRNKYLAACAELDETIRSRLVIELVDLPDGAPAPRLSELVGYLRPFARSVCVRTYLDRIRFETLASAHVLAVGTAVGREPGGEAELIEKMNSFTAAASVAGLRTYAFELRSHSLAAGAMGAGFDFISGDIVGSVAHAPASACRFEAADLYLSPSPREGPWMD